MHLILNFKNKTNKRIQGWLTSISLHSNKRSTIPTFFSSIAHSNGVLKKKQSITLWINMMKWLSN